MTHQPHPLDEANRLAALRQYDILDTLPEQAFDDLTLLAARICNAPIAGIGFIDTDRQWFKSKVGLTAQEIPRHISLCSHAIVEPDVCVIRDALADERFANNPLVTSEPHIRFYAAAQLVTPAGHAIGTICVIDHVPRELSAEQEEALRVLARQVMAHLELRRRVAEVEHGLAKNERAHEEILFQASLLNAVEEAVIATELSGKIVYWNRFAEKMYGWPAAEVIGRNVVEVTPSDISQGEAAELMSRLRSGQSWSGEFNVRRRDGSSFPAQVTDSPIYDSNGALIGIVGISTDITERKWAEDALREAHAELERRVAQRTFELTTANALLKEEVNERKRVEQALLESNSLLRSVVEGTNDCIFVKDLKGRYLLVNSAVAKFVGKPAEEIVGKSDMELFPPEVAQHLIEHDHEVIASGEMLELEEKLQYRGKPQTALVVKNVYRNGKGDVIGLIGIARDITERQQVEEKIRESERQLAVAQQIAHLGSWEHDIITDKVTWSDELYRTFGLQPQEFDASYERFIERVHPEDREFFISVREKNSLVPGLAGHEYRIIRPNGEVRILLGHGEIVTDDAGRVVKIYSTTEDITERKRIEEALRESEERFRLLVEGIKEYAIFMLDADGRIASWNEGATRLKGYLHEEIIGQHFSICYTPEDITRSKPEQALRIAATKDRFEDECWLVRKDGSRFWANVIITALRDEAGGLRGFAEITRDITERSRAREARMQLHLRLLDAQEEERRHLSRELHDQMGQHLPALMLGLEALSQAGQSGSLDTDHLQRLKGLVERIAHDTHALARDLRPPVLDDFGLQVALSNYLEDWSERYGIEADFHSNGFHKNERLPPHIEITLFRTVQEALTNVGKHAQAEHVSLILRRSRDEVLAIVEDDGKGFNAEVVKSESINGGRLGLLGMKERVELVGGILEVESTLGAGTTVAIRVPVRTR